MGTRKASVNLGMILDIILGTLIGIAVTMLLTTSRWFWEHGLKDYQDFLAGCMALIGAAGAVFAVIMQIRHAQQMEEERRTRSVYAARAMMPQALSVVCGYAKACSVALREITNGNPPAENHQWHALPADRIPNIPEASMPILKECAEFGDADLQRCIAKLAQTIQVTAARLNSSDHGIGGGFMGRAQFYDRIDDVLEVYARADMLFPYSRMETDSAPSDPGLENMRTAAHLCGFLHQRWEELDQQIRRRYAAEQ